MYRSSDWEEKTFELELPHLQYELKSSVQKKKKKRRTFCVFKSKQNTSCSGQRGQIIRLESVIEEGEKEGRESETERSGEQRQECLSFKWGDEKCCFVLGFFLVVWALQGRSSLPESEPERLADKCLPSMHRHTPKHCEQLYQKLQFSKWNDANERYEW